MVCPHVNFDIVSVSRGYLTISAVMAGFAFAALMTILTRDEEHADQFAGATQTLAIAFIGLLLSAVTYAILTGEKSSRARAATEEVFAGLAFASSAIILIYAIVLTVEAAATRSEGRRTGFRTSLLQAGRRLRELGAFAVAPLTTAYLCLGTSDYADARYADGAPAWLVALWVILVALQTLLALVLLYRRKRKLSRGSQGRKRLELFPLCGLGAICLGSLAVAISQEALGVCEVVPIGVILATLGLTFLVMATATWSFLAVGPETQPTLVDPDGRGAVV